MRGRHDCPLRWTPGIGRPLTCPGMRTGERPRHQRVCGPGNCSTTVERAGSKYVLNPRLIESAVSVSRTSDDRARMAAGSRCSMCASSSCSTQYERPFASLPARSARFCGTGPRSWAGAGATSRPRQMTTTKGARFVSVTPLPALARSVAPRQRPRRSTRTNSRPAPDARRECADGARRESARVESSRPSR